jgi:rhodanese-related sulfurtransferase
MEYRKMGYTNTRALAGGVEGWKKADYGAA